MARRHHAIGLLVISFGMTPVRQGVDVAHAKERCVAAIDAHTKEPQVIRCGSPARILKVDDLTLRTRKLKHAQLEWGVLEAVLIDLLGSREGRGLYSGRNGRIVFGTARPGLVSASDLIDREEPPSELSAVQVQRTLEAAKNAAWSQHERDSVESFRPTALH